MASGRFNQMQVPVDQGRPYGQHTGMGGHSQAYGQGYDQRYDPGYDQEYGQRSAAPPPRQLPPQQYVAGNASVADVEGASLAGYTLSGNHDRMVTQQQQSHALASGK